MMFNKGTLVQCVNEEDYEKINYFFELNQGIKVKIYDKCYNNSLQVVCLNPLKVIEIY